MNKYNTLNVEFSAIKDQNLILKIQQICTKKIYKKNDIITYPGDTITTIKYIYKGKSRSYIIDDKGNEKILYDLGGGWFLREHLFLSHPYSVIAKHLTVATMDTEIYHITRENYNELLKTTNIALELLQSSSLKKSLIINDLTGLCFSDIKTRIIKLLVTVTFDNPSPDNSNWHNTKYHYTHKYMSQILGYNRVSISKAMKKLIDNGNIRVVNHLIQVSNDTYNKYKNL